MKFEWKHPEIMGAKDVKDYGHILVSEGVHKSFPLQVITTKGIQRIDDKGWELLVVTKESDNYYYCNSVFGLGLMNIMVHKSNTRPFLDSEIDSLSGKKCGMVGSHSGKLSQSFNLNIRPFLDVLEDVTITVDEFKEIIESALETGDYTAMHAIVDKLDTLYYDGIYGDRMDSSHKYYELWRLYFDYCDKMSKVESNFEFRGHCPTIYGNYIEVCLFDKFMDSFDYILIKADDLDQSILENEDYNKRSEHVMSVWFNLYNVG